MPSTTCGWCRRFANMTRGTPLGLAAGIAALEGRGRSVPDLLRGCVAPGQRVIPARRCPVWSQGS
jgi:hypothetical protein